MALKIYVQHPMHETTRRQKLKFALNNANLYVNTLGIITPENPMGEKSTEHENAELRGKFKAYCKKAKYVVTPVRGSYGNPERSYILSNIELNDLMQIADMFMQESFIYAKRDSSGRLTFLYYKRPAKDKPCVLVDYQNRIDNQQDAQDFFTRIGDFKFNIPFPIFNESLNKCVLDTQEMYESSYYYSDWEAYRDKSLEDKRTFRSRMEARASLIAPYTVVESDGGFFRTTKGTTAIRNRIVNK